jgi:hypothetical protein
MSQKRYEYKLIDPALWRGGDTGKEDIAQIEEQLNRLGRQGWEIVGFVASSADDGQGHWLAKRKVKLHRKKVRTKRANAETNITNAESVPLHSPGSPR